MWTNHYPIYPEISKAVDENASRTRREGNVSLVIDEIKPQSTDTLGVSKRQKGRPIETIFQAVSMCAQCSRPQRTALEIEARQIIVYTKPDIVLTHLIKRTF